MLEEDFPSQSYREVNHETGNKVSAVRSMPVALTYRGGGYLCVCPSVPPRRERNQRHFRTPFPDRFLERLSRRRTSGSCGAAPEDAFSLRSRNVVAYTQEKTSRRSTVASTTDRNSFLFASLQRSSTLRYILNSFRILLSSLLYVKKKRKEKERNCL